MAGIRALAGDTTALRTTINIMFTYMQEPSTGNVRIMFALLKRQPFVKKMYNTVILVTPLGSRHHLGHGAHEVFVCDSYGVDIQHKFL